MAEKKKISGASVPIIMKVKVPNRGSWQNKTTQMKGNSREKNTWQGQNQKVIFSPELELKG